jgi:hypothetical protein
LEKSHKFLKIPTSHNFQEYEFRLTHLYKKFGVPLQVVNMTWFHKYSKARFEFEIEI